MLSNNRYNRFGYKVQWNAILENSLENYRNLCIWIEFSTKMRNIKNEPTLNGWEKKNTPQNLLYLCWVLASPVLDWVSSIFFSIISLKMLVEQKEITAIVFSSIHWYWVLLQLFVAYWQSICNVLLSSTRKVFCGIWLLIEAVMSSFHRSNAVLFLLGWFGVSVSNIMRLPRVTIVVFFFFFSSRYWLLRCVCEAPIDTDCCGQALKLYRFHSTGIANQHKKNGTHQTHSHINTLCSVLVVVVLISTLLNANI